MALRHSHRGPRVRGRVRAVWPIAPGRQRSAGAHCFLVFVWLTTLPLLQSAMGAAAPMAREQERALVVEICEGAWAEAGDVGMDRGMLLAPLAAVDPGRAEKLIETLPEAERPAARVAAIRALLHVDWDRALVLLGKVPDTADALLALSEAGTALAPDDPVRAKGLLERMLTIAHGGDAERLPARLLACAALAKRLGDPRTADLQARALASVPELARKALAEKTEGGWSWVMGYSFRLAASDPDAAVRLLAQIPDAEERRRQGLQLVTYRLARLDPVRALSLLDAHPPQEGWDDDQLAVWSEAALKTAASLAPRDVAAALALARRIPRLGARALALAAAAGSLPAEQAAELRRQASGAPMEEGALAAVGYVDWRRRLKLAALMPPGPERRAVCVGTLRAGFGGPFPAWGNCESLAHAAFLLAPSDQEGARALLEDGLASFAAIGEGAEAFDGRSAAGLAVALVSLDPERAAAAARALPEGRSRMEALAHVALYLAVPPEARTGLTLERLLRARNWLPEEDLP